MAAIVHFAPAPLSSYTGDSPRLYSFLMMVLVALLGILMVSTLRYTSFKNVGTGRQSVYFVLLIAAIGMSIWLYSQYALLILSGTYVAHGIVWYLISLTRSRSKSAIEAVRG